MKTVAGYDIVEFKKIDDKWCGQVVLPDGDYYAEWDEDGNDTFGGRPKFAIKSIWIELDEQEGAE